MGKIATPGSVKVIVGLILNKPEILDNVVSLLQKNLGPVDRESELLVFNHTSYYNKEMGSELKRKFLSFKSLMRLEDTYKLKMLSNNIEKKFSDSQRRNVNIDPGYVTAGKVVLLTTKDYTHRIYVRGGIYAEATLFFQDGSYRPREWTYPDYKTTEYVEFFNGVRDAFIKDLKDEI